MGLGLKCTLILYLNDAEEIDCRWVQIPDLPIALENKEKKHVFSQSVKVLFVSFIGFEGFRCKNVTHGCLMKISKNIICNFDFCQKQLLGLD